MVKKKTGDKNIDLVTTYQNLFDTEDGKTVLYDLLGKMRFFTSTLGENPEDTSRKEGQREAVVYILEMVNKDVVALKDFIEQQKERQKEYEL